MPCVQQRRLQLASLFRLHVQAHIVHNTQRSRAEHALVQAEERTPESLVGSRRSSVELSRLEARKCVVSSLSRIWGLVYLACRQAVSRGQHLQQPPDSST